MSENENNSAHQTKLNLGCGDWYKPGFINVDRADSPAADVRADVRFLPFRDGSVVSIEADHLLEHFDAAHVRIVLWECHRVLASKGTLAIETPDLEKAVKALSSSKGAEYDAKLQWIYGVDSPGLGHKTGFTKALLRRVLGESSFDNITFETPMTHTYERGLRAVCTKREPAPEAEVVIAGTINTLVLDRQFDDSFVIIPLREELVRMLGPSPKADPRLLSRACVLNPVVALALSRAFGHGRQRREIEAQTDIMNHLKANKLHERAYTLWKKSVKSRGDKKEFDEFTKRLSRDVRTCLEEGDLHTKALGYVLRLDPSPIRLMAYRLVVYEGQRMTSLGMKMFALRDAERARTSFEDALATNPRDFVAAWNLARVLALNGGLESEAEEAYKKLVKAVPQNFKTAAEKELEEYRTKGNAPDTLLSPYPDLGH